MINNRLLIQKSESSFQLGSWATNSAIQSGLSDIGAYSTPEVFEFDGDLYLISGNSQGLNDTWKWNGSQWIEDYDIDNGIDNLGTYSCFTVFEISGTYYMIGTSSDTTFTGYHWGGFGGNAWNDDSGIVNGLSSGYGYQTIDVGYIGSDLFALVGTNNSTYKWLGFKWNGSSWSSNSAIISGINTDRYGRPCFLNIGSDTYLICGDRTTSFYGYKWNGSGWSSNSQIIDGLTPDNFYNVVSAFFLDNTLYAIVGSALGTLRGFMNS